MAAEVDICNRALQKLGAQLLTSLSDDSRNARSCNAAYSTVRDEELAANPWSFAIKRASIAADAVLPTWGRTYSYTLPADFLRLLPRYPEDDPDAVDWIIEGSKILTDDSAPLQIRYIAQITDTTAMPSLFREVLAAKLAVELCEDLTQSNSNKQFLLAEYEQAVRRAKMLNAIQKVPQAAFESSWISEREDGSGKWWL